jgi:hypothetical protein
VSLEQFQDSDGDEIENLKAAVHVCIGDPIFKCSIPNRLMMQKNFNGYLTIIAICQVSIELCALNVEN